MLVLFYCFRTQKNPSILSLIEKVSDKCTVSDLKLQINFIELVNHRHFTPEGKNTSNMVL